MGIFLQGGANLRPGGILGYRGGLNEIEGWKLEVLLRKSAILSAVQGEYSTGKGVEKRSRRHGTFQARPSIIRVTIDLNQKLWMSSKMAS